MALTNKLKHLSYNQIRMLESTSLVKLSLSNIILILISFGLKLSILWFQILIIIVCGCILAYIIQLIYKIRQYQKELEYRLYSNE